MLRFSTGTEIGPHTDRVESGDHYRLNIVIKPALRGGEFVGADPIYVKLALR